MNIKRDATYWIFEGNNKYSRINYTLENAIACYETLINCRNLIDCKYCEDCEYCEYCSDCYECIRCEYLNECSHCENSYSLECVENYYDNRELKNV